MTYRSHPIIHPKFKWMRILRNPVKLILPLVINPCANEFTGEYIPSRRKSQSCSRARSASLSELGRYRRSLDCSFVSSYIFCSTGLPGCILFFIPSIPAISKAENARYGFEEESGTLYSILYCLQLRLLGDPDSSRTVARRVNETGWCFKSGNKSLV